jgi:hypothetical protein
MEKSHILLQIKAFMIDALREFTWVSAVLNSVRHEGNASIGIIYTDTEGRQTPMNTFDPLRSFEVSNRIHEFFVITQQEGTSRWNNVRFSLPDLDQELMVETWLDQQIDDEVRFLTQVGK